MHPISGAGCMAVVYAMSDLDNQPNSNDVVRQKVRI